MKSLVTITVAALLSSLTLATVSTSTANAQQPKALLVAPNPGLSPGFALPRFGFNSFNIAGYGERVTFVQWGGLASQMGLECGDTVVSMNGFPLHYHGAWSDALYQAMASGGWVQLTIVDVRSGMLANRQIFLGGGIGPVTPKIYGGYNGPITSNYIANPGYGPGYGTYPVGPVTAKSQGGPQNGNTNLAKSINQVIKMFQD